MREQIIELVTKNQKNFSSKIKQNPEMLKWVEDHTLVSGDVKLSEKIYSAVNQESGICPRGNKRSFETFSTGYRHGCGHSSVCQCCKEQTAKKVSEVKLNYTEEQKQAIQQKREDTMVELYGVPFSLQREDVKVTLRKSILPETILEKLTNKDWLNEEYNIKQRSMLDIGKELGVYYGTVGDYCKKHGFTIRQRACYSMIEIQLKQFIESLNIEVEHSNWDIIENREIDLYIPTKNIGIEVNGLYWHSFNPDKGPKNEDRNKHLTKTINARASNVELIHITDYEWRFKNELVKSFLLAKLGKATKIVARKCQLREVSPSEEREFLTKNHFQGYIASKYVVGLYFNDELISIMSIGSSRFDKDSKYELLRFCNKLNTVVIGGANKLFSNILSYIGNEQIISYCDVSKFNGKIYETLGFTKVNEPSPGYFWTDGDEVIISRFKCQKKHLKQWLPSFDETKSESENMFAAGFRRFWDCGQQKFVRSGNNQPLPINKSQTDEVDIYTSNDVDDKEIVLPKVNKKTPIVKQDEIVVEQSNGNLINDLFSEVTPEEVVATLPVTPSIIEIINEPIINQQEQIQTLIETKPKHFAKMIRNDSILWKWVTDNSLLTSDNVAEMIHSAMNQLNNICKYGNTMRFISVNDGYGGCGHGCKCANEKRSISSKKSHSENTTEEKAMAVQKRRETNLKEYGHINAAQTESVKQKHKDHYDSLRTTNTVVIPTAVISDADRGYERFKKTVNDDYNFTLLTPRADYHGIRQKDAYEYRFQCNICGSIQNKKFNHARGIVCTVCKGEQSSVKGKITSQETIKQIVESNPTNYSRIIKNDSDLIKWITENTLVKSDNLAENCYSAVYQVSNICENGNIKKFTSFKEGYRGCGRAGVCQCANDLIKQSLKKANSLS